MYFNNIVLLVKEGEFSVLFREQHLNLLGNIFFQFILFYPDSRLN